MSDRRGDHDNFIERHRRRRSCFTTGTANPETELILGITMYEDVFLAVYVSLLSGIVNLAIVAVKN